MMINAMNIYLPQPCKSHVENLPVEAQNLLGCSFTIMMKGKLITFYLPVIKILFARREQSFAMLGYLDMDTCCLDWHRQVRKRKVYDCSKLSKKVSSLLLRKPIERKSYKALWSWKIWSHFHILLFFSLPSIAKIVQQWEKMNFF